MINKKPKIAFIVTSVLIVHFFLDSHLKKLSKDYEITLIVKNDFPELIKNLNIANEIKFINIERKLNIFKDLAALVHLLIYLRGKNFALVHSFGTKAGLLGMLASLFYFVPNRIYTYQGEVWINKKGIWREILRTVDKIIGLCCTNILVVSFSELNFLIDNKIINSKKATVLGNGSISGVDLVKFSPNLEIRKVEREKRGYKDSDIVFLYLGRINYEKGIHELISAYKLLERHNLNIKLLLVGPLDGISEVELSLLISKNSNIQYEKFTDCPQNMFRCSDILVLPSHREGFGVVVIEAAAVGIPTIGSRIYGISDSLIENHTGLMFDMGDHYDLYLTMLRLVNDSSLRTKLGNSARTRVINNFDSEYVLSEIKQFYDALKLK